MIHLKTDAEIDAMKKAGHFAFELLELCATIIKPGISTLEINDIIHQQTLQRGGISAPLNYKGFPKSLCTSVNNVVCHGIPSAQEILKEGDIINVDVTPIIDGYYGDSSRTFYVGEKISKRARSVTECAKRCLALGIEAVRDGGSAGDIGFVIQRYAENLGFGVVREFVGHGIGKNFHEDPQIHHYGARGKGTTLRRGMVFTIEPMINEKDWRCRVLDDGWTAITVDGGLSAQFEHTVAIRSHGQVEILTLP